MKRSLLLISLVCLYTTAVCQDKIKERQKAVKANHIKEHKVKKTNQGEVIHKAPDQKKIDSIKNEKLKRQKLH